MCEYRALNVFGHRGHCQIKRCTPLESRSDFSRQSTPLMVCPAKSFLYWHPHDFRNPCCIVLPAHSNVFGQYGHCQTKMALDCPLLRSLFLKLKHLIPLIDCPLKSLICLSLPGYFLPRLFLFPIKAKAIFALVSFERFNLLCWFLQPHRHWSPWGTPSDTCLLLTPCSQRLVGCSTTHTV